MQSIYNEDANQWTWTPDVGVEKEVLGPFDTVQVWVKNGIGTSMLAHISKQGFDYVSVDDFAYFGTCLTTVFN